MMSGSVIPPCDKVSPCHGYLHSVETGAAADGPGVRFVYFVSGCQFRCRYCHNPDTWKLHHGRGVTLPCALAELAPYAGFLRFAGGVTVSGGEPLMQPAFVHGLLAGAKAMGLHTALDTQGFLHASVDDDWFDVVDLVLLDIKHSDPVQYQALTGQPLQPTLDFARRLARLGKPMWVRYVLVPGISDDAGDVERLASFVASLGSSVAQVEVLPFHKLGEAKWAELGLPYTLAATPVPSVDVCARVRAQFAAHGLRVS